MVRARAPWSLSRRRRVVGQVRTIAAGRRVLREVRGYPRNVGALVTPAPGEHWRKLTLFGAEAAIVIVRGVDGSPDNWRVHVADHATGERATHSLVRFIHEYVRVTDARDVVGEVVQVVPPAVGQLSLLGRG